MTDAQKKALATLFFLVTSPPEQGPPPFFVTKHERIYYSRYEIGIHARSGYQGYPLKTMIALQVLGYVEPEHEVAVELVQRKHCTCGCDRWTVTDKGKELCATWNIVKLKREIR